MTSVLPERRGWPTAVPNGLPRLLAGLDDGAGLRPHLERWGTVPPVGAAQLLRSVEASGLGGHGGAWFPAGRKWRAVALAGNARHRPVVVANGAEGEPASMKDAVLLTRAPHLVLDGAAAAAVAVGAGRVVAYVHRRHAGLMRAAVAERRVAGLDPVAVDVVEAPDVFLAGQESAAVNVVNGRRRATPSFVTVRSVRERGVENRPTLVHNVETLAHVALIARYGAAWFRCVGDGEGSMLLTVHGAWREPSVVEVPVGVPAVDVLGIDARSTGSFHGALLGGYGGGWVSMKTLQTMRLSEPAARRAGATLGAGVVALLPSWTCPVAEVARLAAYLRDQSAGQCGPCVNGLAEIAALLRHAAFGPTTPDVRAARTGRAGRVGRLGGVDVPQLLSLCDLVDGRGACKHPDGVARMVRSACEVFGEHLAAHLAHGPCLEAARPGVLPVPQGQSR